MANDSIGAPQSTTAILAPFGCEPIFIEVSMPPSLDPQSVQFRVLQAPCHGRGVPFTCANGADASWAKSDPRGSKSTHRPATSCATPQATSGAAREGLGHLPQVRLAMGRMRPGTILTLQCFIQRHQALNPNRPAGTAIAKAKG